MTYQITSLKTAQKLENQINVNERIARLIAKTVTDKKTGAKSTAIDGRAVTESMAVIVPRVSLGDVQFILSTDDGKEWIKSQVEKLQDGILRGLYAAGKNAVFDEQFRNDALIKAMQAEEATTRFSKDSIAVWFQNDLEPLLVAAIQTKFAGMSQDKLDRLVAGYLADFQTLAAREVFMAIEIKNKLTKALALLPDDYVGNSVSERIAEKLSNSAIKSVDDAL